MSFGNELGKAIIQEFSPEFRKNNKLDEIDEEAYVIISAEFINDKTLLNDFIDWYYGKKEMYSEETLAKGIEIVNGTLRYLDYIISDEGKWIKREFLCPNCRADLRIDNSMKRETYFEDYLRLKDNKLCRTKDHEIKHDNIVCINCGTLLNDFIVKFQYGNIELFKESANV